MTTSRRTERRTVLKTTGGLLAGAATFTGSAAAQEEELGPNPLEVDIRQQVINPRSQGVIPVEAVPTSTWAPGNAWFPGSSATYLGHGNQILVDGEQVIVSDEEGVANPVRAKEFRDGRVLMHFRTQDIDFSGAEVEDGALTMEIGIINGIFVYGTDEVSSVDEFPEA